MKRYTVSRGHYFCVHFRDDYNQSVLKLLKSLLSPFLALYLLFHEWGWQPLLALMQRLSRWRVIQKIEGLISRAPPYLALLLFALPSLVLIPAKLFALWLIKLGHWFWGASVFVLAKVIGTALVARLFMLTKDALLQINWFARLYHTIMPWKEAVFARIRASSVWRMGRLIKDELKHFLSAQLAKYRAWRNKKAP